MTTNRTNLDELRVQCCFCGLSMQLDEEETVVLTTAVHGGGEQDLYCHFRCLRAVVLPNVPLIAPD